MVGQIFNSQLTESYDALFFTLLAGNTTRGCFPLHAINYNAFKLLNHVYFVFRYFDVIPGIKNPEEAFEVPKQCPM